VTGATATSPSIAAVEEHASPSRLAWRRFRRNRLAMASLIVLLTIVTLAFLAPWISPYDPARTDTSALRQPPSLAHPFGTDGSGRDMFARVLYGARISLTVGFLAVSIYLVIGTVLGAISGYLRGPVDSVIQRTTDAVMAFPALIIIIALVPVLGPSLTSIVLVLGLLGWPGVCRIVRAEFLSLREREFTLAARGLGAGPGRIIVRHLLPNVAGPLIVVATFGMAEAIIAEAGLSLLSLGIQPPDTSWGLLLSAARDVGLIAARPWLWIFPGAALAITVLAINFVGDGIRDALDPREVARLR
jgi:peptide/nickel transport system permease protein